MTNNLGITFLYIIKIPFKLFHYFETCVGTE